MEAQVGETTFTTPSDVEVTITRAFVAPASLVFAAHTSPEHLPSWLIGPPGWTMPVCEVDLRPGGFWHYIWRSDGGEEFEMRGEYREVSPSEEVVWSESWGGPEDTLSTVTFEERDGKTTVTMTKSYPSEEARDSALEGGMKEGTSLSHDRLAEYLTTIG